MIRFVLLALALAALQSGPAQPDPADQYHAGAQAFVDGDNARALQAVEAGLASAPNDPRLNALRDLIQQQQDEQDQQDGGQQDQADNSDPSDAGEDGDQGQDGDQGDGDSGEGNPPPPSDDGQQADADQTNTAPQDPASSGEAPPTVGEPGQMTEAQAQRLLDAVGGDEQLLLRQLRRAPTRARRSDKDW